MIKNLLILGLFIMLLCNCSKNSVTVLYHLKHSEESSLFLNLDDKNNILFFDLNIKNNTHKKIIVPYNKDKLIFNCVETISKKDSNKIYFTKKQIKELGINNRFIIENEKGYFRDFFDLNAVREFTSGAKFHCQDSVNYISLDPRELAPIGIVRLDKRLLNSKKNRLWFIHKKDNKLQYIKSNWIHLK
jgi:hypothetical protein